MFEDKKAARFLNFFGFIASHAHRLRFPLEVVPRSSQPAAIRTPIKRRSERRRQDWYRADLNSIVERDVPEIADIAAPERIPRLLEISARFAGQLTNLSEIGRAIGLDHKTAEHYLQILEQIYLVQQLQPWSRNELSRLVKTPKLQFVDSGQTRSRLRS